MAKTTFTSSSGDYWYTTQPFSVSNDAWGVGSLVAGVGYTISGSYDPTNFAAGVSFTWSFPKDVGGVYAYPHLDYNTQYSTVSTTQVGNIASLSVNYSAVLTNPTSSTLAFDLWFNSDPNGGWTTTSKELLIEVHSTSAGTPNEPFKLSGSNFSNATVYVSNASAEGANWQFIDVKTATDMMSGTLSLSDIIKGLIWNGVLTGQEYLTSIQLGSEVHGGTGSLQLSASYDWTANPTLLGTSANDNFSIATPGGHQVVGNGGVDTVTYSGSYSNYQIKSVGTEILVTSGNNISTLDELQGITYIKFSDGVYNTTSKTFTSSVVTALAVVATPQVVEKLLNDTGASSTDKITSSAALTGSADANSVVKITEGGVTLGSVTADAKGNWSFTPSGLADGSHTIVATETNSAGVSGSASLTFTLDTTKPTVAFSGEALVSGKVVLTGTASEAGDTISIYDGTKLLGTTTSGSGGAWSFNAGAVSNTTHVFSVTATDVAGNVGTGANDLILGSTKGETLVSSGSPDILVGGGGSDTFVFKSAASSKPSSPDIITDFDHVHDTILFSGISGINATNGIALFQGQLTGTGNFNLHAHSVAYIETGGKTQVLVNTSNATEIVSAQDAHLANMMIVLNGTHLGLTSSDFHVA
ncbi:Ig-like domain-containing protein [Bradyrhizobium sp.]|uniref:Ig-like domain-containing protein n=1 Tax=Bradyrhizobium sp. TaxID=376 RepID=UPI0039E39E63